MFRLPVFRHAARLDPAEVTALLPLRTLAIAFRIPKPRRPSDHRFTRLNRFTRAGCGLGVALPTLRSRPHGRPRKARFAAGGEPFDDGNLTRSVSQLHGALETASKRRKTYEDEPPVLEPKRTQFHFERDKFATAGLTASRRTW